jgi:hypothetical protein
MLRRLSFLIIFLLLLSFLGEAFHHHAAVALPFGNGLGVVFLA